MRHKKRKTKFKEKVYEIVRKIPKGKTLTYKQVAEMAGFPGAWRAVGNVLNKNKNPQIPCHRVIRSDGKIGGYKNGSEKKKLLLKREGATINENLCKMEGRKDGRKKQERKYKRSASKEFVSYISAQSKDKSKGWDSA